MPSTPKISVLMPIYNTNEEHLREAIESILSQTYDDFEFLILNDSPSNLALDDLVKSYNDERIVYLKNDKNLGITPSRNKLLALAKGEFIAVMDHDDVSLPHRFEEQVKALNSKPEVGVVGCLVDTFSGKKLYFPSEDNLIKTLLMDICAIVHPASMIKKSVLLNNNLSYEEEYSPSEDYQLWCRLISCSTFYNIQKVLFRYRDHDENTSTKAKEVMLSATNKIHEWIRREQPGLYQQYLNTPSEWTCKLFGFIPFCKIITKKRSIRVYLFNIIPLFKIYRRALPWQK